MQDLTKVGLSLCQMELQQANDFVALHHRHHKPLHRVRFSLGVKDMNDVLRGVAMVGRPVARMVDPRKVVEVSRLCTDGATNAASFLYGAAARASYHLGYEKIQTYILASEPGTSLKAAGWVKVANVPGEPWTRRGNFDGEARRTDQPNGDKTRWERKLR